MCVDLLFRTDVKIFQLRITMKKSIDTGLVKFYLWVGLGFLSLWLINSLVNYTETFGVRSLNEIWRMIYIIPVNFIFFEYTFPYLMLKRKYLLSNIILFIVAIWVQMILYAFGLYAWRYLGIQVNIYTALATYTSVTHGASEQVSIGFASG
jgi:hypothetical protein